MKKILILLIVLAAIAGIAYYKSNERDSRLHRSSSSVKTRELLFPEFDSNSIRKIHVKEAAGGESTLTVQNDTWVVSERGGYPAEKEKLQTVLLSLQYEKIKGARRIGKDSWSKVGVNAPGTAATGVGTLVELFDDKDVLKYSFVLGGQVTSSGGSNNDQMSMFGGPKGNRFIRIQGEDTIWEINDQLPDLVTKPEGWLQKAFIDVQLLKSVEVTDAKPEDSWKASRTTETGDFVLENAKPTEKLDIGKITLNSLLSAPTFSDVLGKDKAAAIMKDAVKAKLVTFEGFTYDIQAVKQAGQGGGDKYYLTVNVSADIPKERPAVKDEKPEDKTKNDAAFTEEKKKKEEKLANEKKFEGWVFEVTEYTVSSLLKKRYEILATPDMKAGPPTSPNGKPAGLPDVKKMIPGLNMAPSATDPASAVTPPAAAPGLQPPASPVPEMPKPELKPAPAPDANPITGEKPAAPAAPLAAPATPPAAEPAKPAAEAPPAPAPDAKK